MRTEMSEIPLQQRVQRWMMACFDPTTSADKQERNHRFLEEALELVQACGATQSEAHQLADYVYGWQINDPFQEVGGVMITLATLCLADDQDMHQAGEVELARIWTKVEQIRAKQAAKSKHSPLPAAPSHVCPAWLGVPSKPVVAFINTGEDWTQHYQQAVVVPCQVCSATGKVNDMINTRYFVDRMHSLVRARRAELMRDAAVRLSVTFLQLSA
jgi:hypothetical protein